VLDAVQCPLVSAALQDEVGEVAFCLLPGQSLLLVFSGCGLAFVADTNVFAGYVAVYPPTAGIIAAEPVAGFPGHVVLSVLRCNAFPTAPIDNQKINDPAVALIESSRADQCERVKPAFAQSKMFAM